MKDTLRALAERYGSALETFVTVGGEEPRSRAYEIGRMAVTDHVGLLEIAEIHHEVLETAMRWVPDPSDSPLTAACQFLGEVLSPFEMSLRGFRETNARLTQLNASLERQNELLAETARSEREAHEARKRAESQLIQSEKLAALGLLVAGVAHEVNNPLAFVLGNMAVLARDIRLVRDLCALYRRGDAVLRDHAPALAAEIADLDTRIDLSHTITALETNLARSVEGLDRIRHLVADLLDFARPDNAPRRSVDLNQGVDLTVRLVQAKAMKEGVTLEVACAPLPAVACEPTKINQVILNLLVNAIDACEAGGRVTIGTSAVENGIVIEVTDTGSGIDPSIRGKIFDPFFTTKPVGQGVGLGLAISLSIVEAHGGVIDVESAPGGGTRFRVRLPLGPAEVGLPTHEAKR